MKVNYQLITKPKELRELRDRLQGEEILAVDTEFVREKTYFPALALIQIATEKNAWLIDPLALEGIEMDPLLDLLEDQRILKILHSSHGDQECFYTTYGITASPTLDTYEAASLVGYGESVSLSDFINKTLQIKIPKFLTRTNWLKRPLSEEMGRYAMADVQYLVPAAQKLLQDLEKYQRKEWALELSSRYESSELYIANPQTIAIRLAKSGRVRRKQYGIFEALVDWREKLAQERNLPRRRIADDDTLINIANSAPKTEEQLAKFRGLNGGTLRYHGKLLLELIQTNRSHPENFPSAPKVSRTTPVQARVVDFLSTYLKALCQKFKVASRLILTVKDLEKIVIENLTDSEQWVELGLCSAQARHLVGEELLAVLNGERGLKVQAGQLEMFNITSSRT